MAFCQSCDVEIPDAIAACPHCGEQQSAAVGILAPLPDTLVDVSPSPEPKKIEKPTALAWVYAAVVLGLPFLLGRHGVAWLVLIACVTFVNIVYNLAGVVVGWMSGIKIEAFVIGAGTPLFQSSIGDCLFLIRWMPFSSYVTFAATHDGSSGTPKPTTVGFFDISPWKRLSLALAAPIAIFVLAIPLLGPERAVESFRATYGELFPRLPQKVQFNQFLTFLPTSYRIGIGIIAAKLAAVNLLPLPVLNGGIAFRSLLEGVTGRRMPETLWSMLSVVMIFGLLAFAGWWGFEILKILMYG